MIDVCSEWGGPKEYFKIYSNPQDQQILNYKKYKFNCDSIAFYYSNDSLLQFKKNKILTDIDKKTLSQLFLDLMKAKINEVYGSNAGSVYHLKNSDSTLNISVITDKTDFNEKYIKFKDIMKLEN